MVTEIARKLFTVHEYHKMAQAGILREHDRVELIDGEIIELSPVGHPHWVCVNRATAVFTRSLGERAVVSIQNPVRLSDWTEPQPDAVVFKPRLDFYAGKRPTTEDVLFIVEVADSSLAYDSEVKLPRYARAGIPEVWIEDLRNEVLLVYRDPSEDNYSTFLTLHRGESIAPRAFPDVMIEIEDLLGDPFQTGIDLVEK